MRKSLAASMAVVGAIVCLVGSAAAQEPSPPSSVPQKPKPQPQPQPQRVQPNPAAPAAASGWALPSDIAPTPDTPDPKGGGGANSTSSKSVKITYESNEPEKGASSSQPPSAQKSGVPGVPVAGVNEGDHPQSEPKKDPLTDSHFLHGFRIGYSFVANYNKPVASLGGRSFKDAANTRSPHNFLIGYEVLVRMMGHSWLNVILLANGIIGGLEQSKVLPSGNALIGFEFNNSFQIGVGAHLTPLRGQEAHTAFAGGWTPRVGNFYIPVHVFFIPDVDGNHRTGMLSGVTW